MTSFIATFSPLDSSPHCLQGALLVFLALAIGHAIADFPLQGLFLSEAKNRHGDLSNYFKNEMPRGVWIHALTAHSLIHAGAVWLITGSVVLALIELVLHWVIDFAKCEGWTGFNTDQLLHYLCKLSYAALIWLGVSWI